MAADEPEVLVPIIIQERGRTEYVTREVHEHRAPTDASVKLLREMETAAEKEVIKAVKVGDTSFECVVHVFKNQMSGTDTWRAIFKLNGKAMTVAIEVDEVIRRWAAEDVERIFSKLVDEMAKEIGKEVLTRAWVQTASQRFNSR